MNNNSVLGEHGSSKALWVPVCVALFMGLLFVVWQPLPIDPSYESYHRLAKNWLAGYGFSIIPSPLNNPDIFRTPGYPLLLIFFYWLIGPSPIPIYVFQVILHALTPILIFVLVRRAFPRRAALFSSWLVALYPLTALYVPTILPEPISLFVTALSVWLFLKVLERPSVFRSVLLGVVFAYGTLLRPSMALLSLAMFLGVWVAVGGVRQLVRAFIVSHIVFAVVMSPWIIRNYRVSGEIIPLTIESSLQLWLATLNYGQYTDLYWTHPLYLIQRELSLDRMRFVFDQDDKPYPVELQINNPDTVRPIYLHYRRNDEGATRRVRMHERGGSGRFFANIPPQAWGTRVHYFFTLSDPDNLESEIRFPPKNGTPDKAFRKGARDGTFYYRVVPNILSSLGPDVVDLNYLSRLSSFITGRSNLGIHEKLHFDFNGDGQLNRRDLEEAFNFLLGSQESEFKMILEGRSAFLIRNDKGEQFRLPHIPGEDSVYPMLLWKNLPVGLKKALIPARRNPDLSTKTSEGVAGRGQLKNCLKFWESLPGDFSEEEPLRPRSPEFEKIPCYWRAGMSVTSNKLMEFRVYQDYFWRNFWNWPMSYLGGSLLRIPRIWIVVGNSEDRGQTYWVGGGGWLYPLLTISTLVILVLAVAGITWNWRTWRQHWYMIVPIIYVSLVHAPFHPEARYSLPGRPFLLVYVALIVLSIWDTYRKKIG